jgi:hypothetical protein
MTSCGTHSCKQQPQERLDVAKEQNVRGVCIVNNMQALKLFGAGHCCNHTQHRRSHIAHSALKKHSLAQQTDNLLFLRVSVFRVKVGEVLSSPLGTTPSKRVMWRHIYRQPHPRTAMS